MVELMLDNKWKTGKTAKALAAEWGITYQYARELSAEASRIVRTEYLANISSTVIPALTEIVETGKVGRVPGDLAAAVSAAKVLADMAGLNEPDKAPEQSENAPRTITVTYHQSVKPSDAKSE